MVGMVKLICKSCTFEWVGPTDTTDCPFCLGHEIAPFSPPQILRCEGCSYIWTTYDDEVVCPVCAGQQTIDYIYPEKLRCSSCLYQWTERDDIFACPKCTSRQVTGDYSLDKRYDIVLEAPGTNRKQIIYALMDLCTIHVAEAEDMTQKCPVSIISGVDEIDAENIKARFEDMGAKISVKAIESSS